MSVLRRSPAILNCGAAAQPWRVHERSVRNRQGFEATPFEEYRCRMRTQSFILPTTMVILLANIGIEGCRARTVAAAAPEYVPTSTIKELMQSIVDPSADVVWNSVNIIQTTEKGTVENRPKTDEDWAKIRHSAVALSEAANLLMM